MADALDALMKLLSEEENAKEKGLQDYFLDDILETALEYNDQSRTTGKRVYKPSFMHCDLRFIYLYMTGHDPDPRSTGFKSLLRTSYGNAAHDMMQTIILSNMKEFKPYKDTSMLINEDTEIVPIEEKYMTKAKEMEVKFYNKELNMRGMVDGLGRYKKTNVIIEIKTEDYERWKNRFEVKNEHKIQGACYSLCLGINDILFPYIPVGAPYKVEPLKILHYRPTEEDKQYIIDKINHINMLIEKQEVPEKCKSCAPWCGYKSVCKELNKKESR